MNNVKDLSIRMSYDKRLKAMQTGQLETSKELYNDRAETQKKLEMLTSRLDDTNTLLAAAESERDRCPPHPRPTPPPSRTRVL